MKEMDTPVSVDKDPTLSSPPAIPSSVAELVGSAGGGVQSFPPEILRGPVKSAERLKIRAFEMFVEGTLDLSGIAKELGCSRQYLYRLAKIHGWAERKANLRTTALLTDEAAVTAVEIALAELRSKIHQRVLELDELCTKRNLKAILAWLQMSGLNGKQEVERLPSKVEVYNDLSDNRQVTVVKNQGGLPDGKHPERDE